MFSVLANLDFTATLHAVGPLGVTVAFAVPIALLVGFVYRHFDKNPKKESAKNILLASGGTALILSIMILGGWAVFATFMQIFVLVAAGPYSGNVHINGTSDYFFLAAGVVAGIAGGIMANTVKDPDAPKSGS
jgi:hypothetical protein